MAGARDPDFCHPVKKAYSSGGYFSKNEFNAISNEIMPQIDKKVCRFGFSLIVVKKNTA